MSRIISGGVTRKAGWLQNELEVLTFGSLFMMLESSPFFKGQLSTLIQESNGRIIPQAAIPYHPLDVRSFFISPK